MSSEENALMIRRPLRLGVIGVGGVAQSSHLPALAILQQRGWPVSVVAIADPDSDRIAASAQRLLAAPTKERAAKGGASFQTYADGQSLLASGEIEAVLLLTPPAQTAELLQTALASGIPTLAEKPAAPNAQTLALLVRAEKEAANPRARIAYNRRSMPLALPFLSHLREMQAASPAGPLHMEARLWRVQRNEPIFYRDTMVHALDFVVFALGAGLAVQHVQWWPPSQTTGDLPSGLHVALQAENGNGQVLATAHLDARPAVGRDLESYEVLGDKKSLKLTYPHTGAASSAPAELLVYENGQHIGVTPLPPCPLAGDIRPILGGSEYNVTSNRTTSRHQQTFSEPPSIGRMSPARGQGGQNQINVPAPNASDQPDDDPTGLGERGFLPQLAHFLRWAAGDENAGATLCTLNQAHTTALLKETLLAHV